METVIFWAEIYFETLPLVCEVMMACENKKLLWCIISVIPKSPIAKF